MRAVTLTGTTPDDYTLAEVGLPQPAADEVLVQVAAVGLNPVDVKIRAAAIDFGPIIYSDRPGWDVAGTVVSVGAAVTDVAVGDRVFGLARFPAAAHTLADAVAVPAADLALVPATWSDTEAGAAALAALTAWQALDAALGVGAASGSRLLILGGAGGVGHLAIQLAKARGATVIATASAAKHDTLRELGADEVVDYHDAAALAAIAPVAAVISTVDSDLPPREAIAAGTTVVTITGFPDGAVDTLQSWGAAPVEPILVHANGTQLREIAELAAQEQVRPLIDSSYGIAEYGAAQRRVESGHVTGKVVVTL